MASVIDLYLLTCTYLRTGLIDYKRLFTSIN